MRHSFIDKYAYLSTPVHNLNPRLKLVIFAVLLIYFLVVPVTWWVALLNIFSLGVILAISHVPMKFVFKRLVVIFPFLFVIIFFIPLFQEQTWGDALRTFVRALCSVMTLILYMSTTRIAVVLSEMRELGVPGFVVQILSFMYRFFFIFTDELEHIELAVKARNPKGSKKFYYKAITRMLGMLIIRSYERSEQIYQAMQLRGYANWESKE